MSVIYKAQKGTPQYEEWLRKYREKRGKKIDAEEAKSILKRNSKDSQTSFELSDKEKRTFERTKLIEGSDFNENTWKSLRHLSTSIHESVIDKELSENQCHEVSFKVGSNKFTVTGSPHYGGHNLYQVIGQEKVWLSTDDPQKYLKGKISDIKIENVTDLKTIQDNGKTVMSAEIERSKKALQERRARIQELARKSNILSN